PNAMTRPSSVLIISNDVSTPFAKTSEFLLAACERLGIPAIVRDSADPRMLKIFLEELQDPKKVDQAADAIAERYIQLVRDFGIDWVISLDLNWLIIP